MGTEKIKHLQSEIKKTVKNLGWSQNRLGREVYFSLYEDDDETEINRMVEKVKKHLSRSTTNYEILDQYLSVIANHPEYIKSQRVIPYYVSLDELEPQLEQEMKIISKSVTRLVEEK